ncbi:SHOCT domain-containing protein [Extibacter muris]|uniref:SHOCT domain-containing protein n=1 Tax=Extibacter muris TaxID=1796622 RepID=A0A4R4FEF1_9FIRM|nr:SHOCT domain-containing protein [Extibacter muris]MCU0079342.1 SHOCT domain-containing protein [Extibacter muris]TDA21935.1 hypothetical protein E1963_09245 [Extibacter muris]
MLGSTKNTEVRKAFKENKLSVNLYYQYCTILEKQVLDDEKILFLLPTYSLDANGGKIQSFLAITNVHIIFILGRGTKTRFIKFPRSELRSYEAIKGGLSKVSVIRFEFMNRTIDIVASMTAYGEKLAEVLADKAYYKGKPKNQKADDPISQLSRLAKLKDIGALSEEEYKSKKEELLKRI